MREYAAVDQWMILLLMASLGLIGLSFMSLPIESMVVPFVIILLIVFLIEWLIKNTYYEFQESVLLCVMGPFKETIHYKNIRSLRLCRNLMSSMAWSTKRIEIKQHNKGYIMGTTYISPKNREDFYDELYKRCKNLQETSLKIPL